MPTNASELTQTPPGDPQWVACDGKMHHGYANLPNPNRPHTVLPSTGTRRDYWRRARCFARTRGIGGWLIGASFDPSATHDLYSLADDSSETTLVTPPTVMKPPAGVK